MSDQKPPDRDATARSQDDTVTCGEPVADGVEPEGTATGPGGVQEVAGEPVPVSEPDVPDAEGSTAVEEPAARVPDAADPGESGAPESSAYVPAGSQDASQSRTETPVSPAGDSERFTWHPEYAGRTVEDVRRELEQAIAADQRQYSIAMAGADEAEQDALASVVGLERKWGRYDFGWAELDAGDLAARIVAFEQERERRREMFSWAEYRRSHGGAGMTDSGDMPPAELSTSMKAISLGLVVLLILLILLVVWAL